ncbi:perilipin-3 [Alligator mississippiensis]|uniref:perilipin-3 n=1 Tax=Alligator mississippiensis TaxID=8496 RepID=UPI002877998D|nr:perilipin-3 [Alligator mississippiensis]
MADATDMDPTLVFDQEEQFAANRVFSRGRVAATYDQDAAPPAQDSVFSIKSEYELAAEGPEPSTKADTSHAQPSAPEQEPELEVKLEPKPELKLELKSEPDQEPKLELKPEPEPEPKLTPVVELKPEQELVAGTTQENKSEGPREPGEELPIPMEQAMPAGPSTTQAVIPGPTLTAAPSPATTVAKGIQALLGCKVGQLVLRSMDRALDTSEEWLDRCLPLPDRVLGTEGLLALPPPPCSKPGCLLRLSALSSSLRNRALALALSKLQRTRRNVRQSLSQLHQTVDLIETIQQGREKQEQSSQDKLQAMWAHWRRRQELGHESGPGGSQEGAPHAIGGGTPALEVETQALAISRNLTQELQSTYLNLMAGVQGLPASLQEKMQQVHQSMAELHAFFSSATSFQDLSSAVLAQSRERVAKAWEAMDELVEFLVQNPPVTWLMESLAQDRQPGQDEGERRDILRVLKDYEPQDCGD